MSRDAERTAISAPTAPDVGPAYAYDPSLQTIYDTAPIGLAFLSHDCRYLRINHHLTELCGISVEEHLGRSVRDCVPALAGAIEAIVHSIVETGEPVTGVEVPRAANDPSWWSNEPTVGRGFVQCSAWLDAGFHAASIDPANTVCFSRRAAPSTVAGPNASRIR